MTQRPINKGAEPYLYQEIPVLDKGYIKLIDYLGTDDSIVAAARVSYAKSINPEERERNEKLINFLMRNRHTSPFEQCSLVFEVKAPIVVFREWHRHRTAKLNEMSGRYTQLPNEVYVPDMNRVKGQSKTNKQGSDGDLPESVRVRYIKKIYDNTDAVFADYQEALDGGVARELARLSLPLNTYSQMVWQCDLHNLLHFLHLRMDKAAQWEIRQFANAIGSIVKDAFPMTWKAFQEHVQKAVTLSASELPLLAQIFENPQLVHTMPEARTLAEKLKLPPPAYKAT